MQLDHACGVESEVVVGFVARRFVARRFVARRLVVGFVVQIVGVVVAQPDLEVIAESGRCDVTPFDQHDAVELGEFVQREFFDVARPVEAVDVGVVERPPPVGAGITVQECERR